MTLLTVQAFSIDGHGGGPRIMRSLLQDGPMPAVSVAVGRPQGNATGSIPEYYVVTRPSFGRLDSTRLRYALDCLNLLYMRSLRQRLERMIAAHSASAIHSIPHGLDFIAAHAAARSHKIPLFLTIHDHPAYVFDAWPTHGLALRLLAEPWRSAAHRYVISQELGEDMAARYGSRPFSVVTDGVAMVEPPKTRPALRRNVYFMGAFHVSYRENLLALLKGLALYRDQHSVEVSVVLRGGGPKLSHEDTLGVPVTVLPWGSQDDVESDIETADVLYMPLPFGSNHEYFVRYSLSTKLITFLASGLPILYHGPEESAAAHLLSDADAALEVYSLDPQRICDVLLYDQNRARDVSMAAATLAQRDFRYEEQRARFWNPICSLASTYGAADTVRPCV